MNQQLGFLIENGDGAKDAIHIAIAPVIAHEDLKPGQRVSISRKNFVISDEETPIGIVDPFLESGVKEGDEFYICLFPNTITSLKHQWTHPEFQEEPEQGDPLNPKIYHCDRCGGDYQKTASGKVDPYDVIHVICRDDSLAWLETFAKEMDLTYDGLLEVIKNWIRCGEYKCYSYDTPGDSWNSKEDMWIHLRNISDKFDFDIPDDEDGVPFTCSC